MTASDTPQVEASEAGVTVRASAAPETRALLPSLAVLGFVLFSTYSGLLAVLLPNQITALDETNKVANLGVVTTISLVFTIVAQPLIGAISDRTRTRWGRRTPWMVIGAAVAAILLFAFTAFESMLWIVICWVVIQVALNVLQNPMTAITPDRIVEERRGVASSVAGLGFMAGQVAGILIAGAVASNLGLAYSTFGILVVIATAAFVLINPDRPSTTIVVPPFRWKAFFAAFWVSPRKHPDFGWAFLARFLFILGYFLTITYQLFLLTDYIGLGLGEANATIGMLSLAGLVPTIVAIGGTGWLSDRLGRRKVFIYVSSVILAVGLAMPLFLPTVGGMVAMAVINGFAFGIYMSADTALMTLVLPDGGKDAGKDLGLLNIATNIPQALSPGIAALVITWFGYPALFVVAIVAVLIAAVVITPIRAVR
ncbi:MAG: MFS transporter [Microbacterium sp.]